MAGGAGGSWQRAPCWGLRARLCVCPAGSPKPQVPRTQAASRLETGHLGLVCGGMRTREGRWNGVWGSPGCVPGLALHARFPCASSVARALGETPRPRSQTASAQIKHTHTHAICVLTPDTQEGRASWGESAWQLKIIGEQDPVGARARSI